MNQRQLAYERLIAPIETRMIRTIWGIVRDREEAQDALQEALTDDLEALGSAAKPPEPRGAGHAHLHQCGPRRASSEAPASAVVWNGGRGRRSARFRSFRSGRRGGRGGAGPCSVGDRLAARNQATAIVMHAVEDIPYDAVAAAMRCHEVTVRTHVARARAKLRALLADLVPTGRTQEKHPCLTVIPWTMCFGGLPRWRFQPTSRRVCAGSSPSSGPASIGGDARRASGRRRSSGDSQFRWAAAGAVLATVLVILFVLGRRGGRPRVCRGGLAPRGRAIGAVHDGAGPVCDRGVQSPAPTHDRVRTSWGIEVRTDGSGTQLVLLHGSRQYVREQKSLAASSARRT